MALAIAAAAELEDRQVLDESEVPGEARFASRARAPSG
jgi:hypothetical protein